MAVDADETYLSDLLSYSLERLNKEPEALANQETRLRTGCGTRPCGTTGHSSTRAGAIRACATRCARSSAGWRRCARRYRSCAGCQRFAGRAEEISRARALNRRTLAAQGTLLELLETPQLQETCLRHGNYDEALDLEAHVEK